MNTYYIAETKVIFDTPQETFEIDYDDSTDEVILPAIGETVRLDNNRSWERYSKASGTYKVTGICHDYNFVEQVSAITFTFERL